MPIKRKGSTGDWDVLPASAYNKRFKDSSDGQLMRKG